MIKTIQDISKIKQDIRAVHQKHVNVRFNRGRNKIVCYSGTLSGVYPEIFTVAPDDKNFLGKTSYSYAEILCGEVKITEFTEKNTMKNTLKNTLQNTEKKELQA